MILGTPRPPARDQPPVDTGAEFGSLSFAGQLLYVELKNDGMDHKAAFTEARYQKGLASHALVLPTDA